MPKKKGKDSQRSLKRKRVPGVLSLSSSKQPQAGSNHWLHSTESPEKSRILSKATKLKTLGGDKRIQSIRLQNHCYSPRKKSTQGSTAHPQPEPVPRKGFLESPKSALLCPSAGLAVPDLSSVGLSLTFTPVLTLIPWCRVRSLLGSSALDTSCLFWSVLGNNQIRHTWTQGILGRRCALGMGKFTYRIGEWAQGRQRLSLPLPIKDTIPGGRFDVQQEGYSQG